MCVALCHAPAISIIRIMLSQFARSYELRRNVITTRVNAIIFSVLSSLL